MWEWKFEVLAEKLLDVRTLDVVGGLDLDNFQDLRAIISILILQPHRPKNNIHGLIGNGLCA